MNPPLPAFTFHPDPVGTGVVEKSEAECVCCGKATGYIYTGAVFGESDLHDSLCPWCIADGSAHNDRGAEFCDGSDFYSAPDSPLIPEEEIRELTERTPIYSGWQQPEWKHHCGHGCLFLGAADSHYLRKHRSELEAQVRSAANFGDEKSFQQFYNSVDGESGVMIWVFRCRVCSALIPHIDLP